MNNLRTTSPFTFVDPATIHESTSASTIWINVDIDVDFPLAAGPDTLLR